MEDLKNKVLIDRTLLAISISVSIFLYSQLDKKLDKITYEKNRLEFKVTIKELMEQNRKSISELVELKTTMKFINKEGLK